MADLATKNAPSGPGRLSTAQSNEVLDRLLDAAMTLFFSDAGFSGTTMERIAKQAGASTKTIYSRFKDKDEILQAVVRRALEQVTTARAAESAMDPEVTLPPAFLLSLARYITRTNLSHDGKGFNRLAFGESPRHRILADTLVEAMEYNRVQIRAALLVWKGKGFLPRLGDADLAARVCHSMISDRSRVFSALGLSYTDEEWEAYVALAVDTFLKGCGYQENPAKAIKALAKSPAPKKRADS